MGTFRDMSSVCRPGYASWCVDTPTAVPKEEPSDPNHQSAGPGSIPLLLLSPPGSSGGETTSPERTQTRSLVQSSSASSDSVKAANRLGGEGEDDEEGGRRTLSPSGAEVRSREDLSPQNPDPGGFLLPRSSPVVSRRHRPVSWHGEEPDSSGPSSLNFPDSGSLSPDQCGHPSASSLEDLGSRPGPGHLCPSVQEEKKPHCVSVSSYLNQSLISLFHLPFSGQQRLAEEQRGRGQASYDTAGRSSPNRKLRTHSGIPEFSADAFKTSCDLDKENAHFVVVDLVLEVLEAAKWTLSSDRKRHKYTTSAEDSPTHSCSTAGQCSRRRTKQHTQDQNDKDEAEHQPKKFSVLSSDSGFEESGLDATVTPRDSRESPSPNAEWLAQQLVLEFKTSWLPSSEPQRGRQSLRSTLQELPGTGAVAVSGGSLTEEIRLRTRMRGSLTWAPPRFQIIFTVQPTLRRSEVVALQHFLCAGCGTEVEPRYIKKLRYCDYLGRYFCDCCHGGSESVIPARVLSSWDFNRYPVSDFSKQLLDSVWFQPLFDLTCVGKTLCSRVKELDKFRELQDQLICIRKLLNSCRFSGREMMEFGQLPDHLISKSLPLFSMDDLLKVKKGQLVTQARAVLYAAVSHVENCQLCLARGFICEFCRERDVIFPFQSDVCRRCPVCKACFHKHCFVEKKCPKCARIQSRRKAADGPKRNKTEAATTIDGQQI
ncbi:protein RUBCNL-like isoform X2 [Echeneis naucrates]|uniref:protein RUBCNL-like isoform X2 n=1 Tax=Echeneis naucrates TaxID=173247 RepID=UPI0011135F11|nr:protein associated with UVRAG as autophagy enhancer isoform X2 [Echeneis naucrates]